MRLVFIIICSARSVGRRFDHSFVRLFVRVFVHFFGPFNLFIYVNNINIIYVCIIVLYGLRASSLTSALHVDLVKHNSNSAIFCVRNASDDSIILGCSISSCRFFANQYFRDALAL